MNIACDQGCWNNRRTLKVTWGVFNATLIFKLVRHKKNDIHES